jgi:N-acetylmuramoyl-L-alanine amidase
MMKRIFAALFLLSFGLLFSIFYVHGQDKPVQKQALKRSSSIPGHGGTDFGASGVYSHEKDIALAISLKLNEMLKAEIPDVETYMTRTTDVFDP